MDERPTPPRRPSPPTRRSASRRPDCSHGRHQIGVQLLERHVGEPADCAARLRHDRGRVRHSRAASTVRRPVISKPLRQRRAGARSSTPPPGSTGTSSACSFLSASSRSPLGGLAVAAQLALFHGTGLRRGFDALGDDKVEAVVALFVGSSTTPSRSCSGGRDGSRLPRADRGGEAGLRVVLRRPARRALAARRARIRGLRRGLRARADGDRDSVCGEEGRRLGLRPAGGRVRGAEGRAAFHRSRNLVRGHWWRVAAITFVLLLLLVVTGPFTGVLVIFVTDAPLETINFATLLFALVLPFTSVALSLLYLDLAVRHDSQQAPLACFPPHDRRAEHGSRLALERLPRRGPGRRHCGLRRLRRSGRAAPGRRRAARGSSPRSS